MSVHVPILASLPTFPTGITIESLGRVTGGCLGRPQFAPKNAAHVASFSGLTSQEAKA